MTDALRGAEGEVKSNTDKENKVCTTRNVVAMSVLLMLARRSRQAMVAWHSKNA